MTAYSEAFSARLTRFIQHESSSGILLLIAAAVAIALDNSPLSWLYGGLLGTPVAVQVGALTLHKPLLLWINDGLMAMFFFLVGLEIKRELIEGHLATLQKAALPAIAAFGGMLLPALIYVMLNANDPVALRGWAIPAATDIAFALGVLSLLGRRVPLGLKVFLLALAILDDLGSIVIIAIFYTVELSTLSLSLATACAVVLFGLNRRGVTRIAPYLLVGIVMWVCVLKSGVHATLAGVFTALTIPLRTGDEEGHSPLHRLEGALQPWVAYGIMPLFAFANAGVSLSGLSLAALFAPIPLGIGLGLFLGKQIGVFSFAWIATRLGLCRLPEGVTWGQMYGVAILAGIGFTMSLFIGTLAFEGSAQAAAVRLGVLSGSTMSAVVGYLVLRIVTKGTIDKVD